MVRSKEVLNQLAKIASESYLSKKVPLNTTLSKIAKEESLAPHQIEYVAAQANHAVWERLYGMHKKASYDFPVADPVLVINQLQVKSAPVVKQASFDYLTSPGQSHIEKTASIELSTVDKTASRRRALKRELQERHDKMAAAKDELVVKLAALERKIWDEEKSFIKQARTLVMEQPFTERGAAMTKIAEFVRSASEDNESLAKYLMKKLAAVVGGQGLIKQADLKAPEEYIDMKMPAKIVNGRHALYITIKTLKDIRQEYDPLHRGYEIVDSSLPELKEKIRGL